MKRLTFLAAVLAASISTAVAVAAPAPKATGDYGYSYAGVQRHLTFNAIQSTTDICGTFWNVTGVTSFSFYLGIDTTTPYTHDATLTQNGQVITGVGGGYPVSGPPYSYYWHVTAGSVVGNTLSLTWVYDGAPDAAGAVTTMTGTIAPNGSIAGTWQDNYPPPNGSRTGTFTAPAGSATAQATYCGKGNAYYSDADGNWYFMNVKAVSVNGNTAWYAAQIIASSSNLGYENTPTNYLFVRVIDNGEPGIGHDFTGGDLMTEAGALAAVANHATPTASVLINDGNIQVH
jgi:hypothetical protein